jgi:hypothetical protein
VRDIGRTDHQPGEGDYLILSNNHVFANTNAGKPGDLRLFPSDAVATLERFEPIVQLQSSAQSCR